MTLKEYGSSFKLSDILLLWRPQRTFRESLQLSLYMIEIDCRVKGFRNLQPMVTKRVLVSVPETEQMRCVDYEVSIDKEGWDNAKGRKFRITVEIARDPKFKLTIEADKFVIKL
jgi:hypothetical protein